MLVLSLCALVLHVQINTGGGMQALWIKKEAQICGLECPIKAAPPSTSTMVLSQDDIDALLKAQDCRAQSLCLCVIASYGK